MLAGCLCLLPTVGPIVNTGYGALSWLRLWALKSGPYFMTSFSTMGTIAELTSRKLLNIFFSVILRESNPPTVACIILQIRRIEMYCDKLKKPVYI